MTVIRCVKRHRTFGGFASRNDAVRQGIAIEILHDQHVMIGLIFGYINIKFKDFRQGVDPCFRTQNHARDRTIQTIAREILNRRTRAIDHGPITRKCAHVAGRFTGHIGLNFGSCTHPIPNPHVGQLAIHISFIAIRIMTDLKRKASRNKRGRIGARCANTVQVDGHLLVNGIYGNGDMVPFPNRNSCC